jgi:hypothetical protein
MERSVLLEHVIAEEHCAYGDFWEWAFLARGQRQPLWSLANYQEYGEIQASAFDDVLYRYGPCVGTGFFILEDLALINNPEQQLWKKRQKIGLECGIIMVQEAPLGQWYWLLGGGKLDFDTHQILQGSQERLWRCFARLQDVAKDCGIKADVSFVNHTITGRTS